LKGRKPTPTALLELQKGKLYNSQRDRGELEPKPHTEMKPKCPAHFSKEEKKIWKGLKHVLDNYGLFVVANALLIELLTTAWVQYLDTCQKMSETKHIIIKGPDGGSMYNPYFNAQHKLGQLVAKYANELGLSSQSLAKIGSLRLKAKKDKEELEDIID